MKYVYYLFSLAFCIIDLGTSAVLSGPKSYSQNKSKDDKYTLVVLPDTQNYTISKKNLFHFEKQIDWIIQNQFKDNIIFISHVGDVVSNTSLIQLTRSNKFLTRLFKKLNLNILCTLDLWNHTNKDQNKRWIRATSQLNRLKNLSTEIPTSVVVGNHDYTCKDSKISNKRFLNYFGPQNYLGKKWFLDSDASGYNMAQTFNMAEKSFIHIGLEYLPSDKAIQFAQEIIIANPLMPVIITTHYYLDSSNIGNKGDNAYSTGDNSPDQLYSKLINTFPQIFLVLSGHIPKEGLVVTKTSLDQEVTQILANYQEDPEGGNGWLKSLEFIPNKKILNISTISPTFKAGESDGPDHSKSSEAQLTLLKDINGLYDYLNSRKILHYRKGQVNQYDNEYLGTVDKYISNDKNIFKSLINWFLNQNKIFVQDNTSIQQGLLKFENIIGNLPGQIRPKTKIEKAILTITSEGKFQGNNAIAIHSMYSKWDISTDWNDLDDGVQIGVEASVKPISNLEGLAQGTNSFDVTESVQNWINGSDNNGWVFIAKRNNFWNFRSSKWKGLVERPMLTIVYKEE